MPKEISPSDRVQVRGQHELMHPGACALCGSGNREDGYIDLDLFFDYEGQIYLCRLCGSEVANALGWFDPDEVAHLQGLAEGLAADVAELKEQLGKANGRLALYDDFYSDRFSLDSPAASASDDSDAEQEQPPASEPSRETVTVSGGGKPIAKKSTPSRRSNDAARTERRDTPTGFDV